MIRIRPSRRLPAVLIAFAWLSILPVFTAARAGDPKVIYSEIVGDPSSIVPGAKDAGGFPVVTTFASIQEIALRPDGGEWVVKGATAQAATNDAILLLGSGVTGTAFAQDGQPLLGGAPGELYDFFDSPVPAAWNASGKIAFGPRAKGGLATVFEKVVVYDPGTTTHTVVIQMGDLALGLIDNPATSSGDERFGNSINSLHLLDTDQPAFVVTPIANCHSSRYPAFFHGNTSFRQSGISAIGAEIWDNFDFDDCGGTSDGAHWFAKGDTENPNTAIDNILAVDDAIVLQEGSPVGGAGPVMVDIFFTRMLSNGDWFCRGDDPASNDWAVRNGVLLAKSGDPISATESWADTFSAFTGNRVGDWLLVGNTTNPDTTRDNVLVLNGTTVLAREGDPVDVNGNGFFDDDAYLNTFQPNDVFLTDDGRIFLLVTLRNGAATGIGDAFLLYEAFTSPGDPFCFGDGSLVNPCPCGNFGVTAHGCQNSGGSGGAQISAKGTTVPDTVVLTSSFELPGVPTIFLQGNATISSGATFGDGLRCAGGVLKRLYIKNASASSVVSGPGVGDLSITARSASLGDTIPPGGVRYYQAYYRDPNPTFCPVPTGNTWNASSGLVITW